MKDRAIAIKTDISKEDEVKKMIEETLDTFVRIDILVNNAGIYRGHLVTEIINEEWEELFATNLYSIFVL